MFHFKLCLMLPALAGGVLAADPAVLRFDMGSVDSPVASGFVRVTPETAYNPAKGYGWESKTQIAFDVPRPPEDPGWQGPSGQVIPREYLIFKEHSDVTRDGVASKEDLVFRVDVPKGHWRVRITVGRLDQPICSEQIFINGKLIARDFDAKHFVRRGGPDEQYGFPRTLSAIVAAEGSIRIRVHGDDTGFRERFLEEFKKSEAVSYLNGRVNPRAKPAKPEVAHWGNSFRRQARMEEQVWVWQDIGGPFTENAVAAIEVYPYVEPPLVSKDGKLSARNAGLQKAVAAFNAGQFNTAEKLFDAVTDPYARGVGYLWLAGHPNYEEELRLVPKALALLNKLAKERPQDLMLAEFVEHARRMDRALYRFTHRADEQRAYNELILVSGEVASFQPEDPLYYKGTIYAGRGFYMVIPHRWTFIAGAGRQLFEEVERAGFGTNRFVKWYLHDHWSEHPPDWVFPDYSSAKKGAPAWASEVYEAYNRVLDLAEWWIKNRQKEDGSLGGGWGDDVEILRTFGLSASINTEASPITMQAVRKIANGAWNSGSIDTEAGYFAEVADAEHSGEWTADTLVAMIRTDYGNPVYIERAMKSGRLMRDLWMARNSKGHFLMRSNFLGATGVGGPGTLNDSRINYRAASPAASVLWYNNSPSLKKILVQWADAWLAASMSTEKGKPRGIIPQEIGFAGSEIGGTNSAVWHKADHPLGSVNFDWEGSELYHDFIVSLFVAAYKSTGDKKYLEPMELEAEFARKHAPNDPKTTARSGRRRPQVNALAPEGSDAWIALLLADGSKQWDDIRSVLFPANSADVPDRLTLDEALGMAAKENEGARARWPHVTTESIATDRVGWPGLGNAIRVMTASGVVGSDPLVTYRGLGREFAAAVLALDAHMVRAVIYNMSTEGRQASVIPWLLDVGSEYSFKVGPDANNDGRLDRVAEERSVILQHRGQEFKFALPGRTQFAIEIRKISDKGGNALAADVALSPEDIRFLPEYSRVDVTIHNIGSVSAQNIRVTLFEGGKEVGREVIPNLEAPLDLDPKTVKVSFRFVPREESHKFTVVVNTPESVEEITKVNNTAVAEVKTPKVRRKQHSGA